VHHVDERAKITGRAIQGDGSNQETLPA